MSGQRYPQVFAQRPERFPVRSVIFDHSGAGRGEVDAAKSSLMCPGGLGERRLDVPDRQVGQADMAFWFNRTHIGQPPVVHAYSGGLQLALAGRDLSGVTPCQRTEEV